MTALAAVRSLTHARPMAPVRVPDDDVLSAVADLSREVGSVTITNLSERIGLSRNATWVRVRKMVGDGRLIETSGVHGSIRLPDPSQEIELFVRIKDGQVVEVTSRQVSTPFSPTRHRRR